MTHPRRAVPRTLVISIAVAIMVGLLSSYWWYQRTTRDRAEERDRLELILDAGSVGWAEATDQFLRLPEVAAQLVGALHDNTEDPDDLAFLLAQAIRSSPALDAAFVGHADGSFDFVAKSDDVAPGGFRTRRIGIDGGIRRVDLSWTSADFTTIRVESDVDDQYDPRRRPWYIPIAAGADNAWSDPYVFSSSQLPGITHSHAITTETGELSGVVGVDLRLSVVSEFLEQLRPGPSGQALIVNGAGRILVSSQLPDEFTERADSSQLTLTHSGEILRLITSLDAGSQDGAIGRSDDSKRTIVVRSVGSTGAWYLAVQALDTDFLDVAPAGGSENVLRTLAAGILAGSLTLIVSLGGLRYLGTLRRHADVDELTGVMSRRAATRRLESMLARHSVEVTAAIVDLDRFKAINDEFGHAIGDRVLAVVARRIEAFAATYGAEVGRIGGDEFIVLAADDAAEAIRPHWRKLSTTIARPLAVSDQSFEVGASVGVAISSPAMQATPAMLLQQADEALFEVKRTGRGSFRIADQTIAT